MLIQSHLFKKIGIGLLGICLGLSWVLSCFAGEKKPRVTPKSCPQDVEVLTEWMLPDLPSYANRVLLRSQLKGSKQNSGQNFVIVAGNPEFNPLSLPNRQFTPALENQGKENVRQVFFSTLEHQYGRDQRVNFQNFYWLFLTQTTEGWRVVALSTQLASLYPQDPPLPPIEATQGIMGQAIALWLRDCRTGSLIIQRRL